MTLGERRVLEVLNGHAFNGPECRPSQQLIADELGCTREYVNRCVRSLARRGLVTVKKERRDGCKWQHNVYTLTHWSPPLRVRTIRRLQMARFCGSRPHRFPAHHTERTATFEWHWNGGREVSCVPNPPLEAKSLSKVACTSNGNVAQATIDDARGALEALQHELNDAHQEIAGLQHQLRRAGAAEMALRRELERVREDEPQAKEIRAVLNHWKRRLGHPRAKCPMTGKRAKVVRTALRSHSLVEALEAIDGLALLPYVGARGRKQHGEPHERHDDVEHCLGDEQRIARFRGYLARAKGVSVDRRLELWRQACALEAAYLEVLLHDVHELNPPESLFDAARAAVKETA